MLQQEAVTLGLFVCSFVQIQVHFLAGAVSVPFVLGILLFIRALNEQSLAEKKLERPRVSRATLCDSE